ncbi:PREDICTED: uncharacterized protein LOC109128327 [Camelina sativa]|uniref:Uncharacterized protein LOC109128327 n=1 Tax=Camelina sativa TaxID=90675 RepID=A0ABM1QTF3_CAMSA|nr:PREDICTED: uncharacterized protein LOC109128327 [Camelina sativa]
MFNVMVRLLILTFFLFSGISNTTLARVQYEPLKPSKRERVWDPKMIKEIKIGVDGSRSRRAPGGRGRPTK